MQHDSPGQAQKIKIVGLRILTFHHSNEIPKGKQPIEAYFTAG